MVRGLNLEAVIDLSTNTYSDAFRGTAYYYARFRRGYPRQFFDLLVKLFALDGTGSLLDLGCGTGQIALPMAGYFGTVFALDPEPEMLAETARALAESGISNTILIEGEAADLPRLGDRLRPLRLVTMGDSFHWTDREATLDHLGAIVEAGGGLVVASAGSLWTNEAPWCAAVKATVQRWLGEQRRAGSSVFQELPERHEAIISRSRFGPCSVHLIKYPYHWTIDHVVGYLYSTSYCSPQLLGNNRAAFEADLRATLLAIDPRGVYTEEVTLQVLIGRRGEA